MSDEPLKSGDIVMLRSGGPKMTISFMDPDRNMCDCDWWDTPTDENTGHQRGRFYLPSLKRVSRK